VAKITNVSGGDGAVVKESKHILTKKNTNIILMGCQRVII
jgi:hypothetical protein